MRIYCIQIDRLHCSIIAFNDGPRGNAIKNKERHYACARGVHVQEAMPLSQLFEVLFDSSVVVKYPIF